MMPAHLLVSFNLPLNSLGAMVAKWLSYLLNVVVMGMFPH